MSIPIHIAVLADNTVALRGARGEHGLALWVRVGDAGVLFDAGQGPALEANAQVLGIEPGKADAIVLSHGHYDHTGGLTAVLARAAKSVSVYAHPDVSTVRCHRGPGGVREIGMPSPVRAVLKSAACRFRPSRQPVEIAPGVRTTGEIPRRHPEETIVEPFYLGVGDGEKDLFPDDQAMFVETAEGIVVLLGCAHAGVINTLDAVRDLTGSASIRAVIGGMHLGSVSGKRLAWTIRELRRFDIRLLAPMHCTGQKADAALRAAFPEACRHCGAGTAWDL